MKIASLVAGLLVPLIVCAQALGQTAPQSLAAKAPASAGMVNLSLVEALAAVNAPQLAGLFSFINENDSPFAFADYLARDKKALKLYVSKLDDDRSLANGLTAWDHSVCASLVNLYSSPAGATFARPDEKRMSKINQCVLAPVVALDEIVARRKR
jgi:hypothetical protein